MREIRFRAWDKENNTMLTWEQLKSEADFSWFADENLVFMQYTGVKDENGVQIFEGDIYRYEYYTGSGVEYRNRVVEWETTEIAYEGVFHGYEINNYEIEVIGNIYEHKHLLE